MLGAEKEIIANYVETGQVRIVYWPMLDHGNASLNAHAAADCIGRQDVDAFWEIHDQFYQNQDELWRADRDYFVNAAVNVGVDQATFESCYDNGDGQGTVSSLDSIRRAAGILIRPSFDINGRPLFGSQSYDIFVQYFEAVLQEGS